MPRLSLPFLSGRPCRLNFRLIPAFTALAIALAQGGHAAAQSLVGSGGSIETHPGNDPNVQNQAGQSSVSVSVAGTINTNTSAVKVVLHGLTTSAGGGDDAQIQLTSFILQNTTTSKSIVLLGATGAGTDSDFNNFTITIQDGFSAAPSVLGGPDWTNNQTVEPSSYWNAIYGSQSNISTYTTNYPQSDGSKTLANEFGGFSTDGTWTLTILGSAQDNSDIKISSWDLYLGYTVTANNPTSTTLTGGNNSPNFSNDLGTMSGSTTNVTLTATVSGGVHGTPTTGTVAFKNNTTGATLCPSVNVNGSGQATCVVAASLVGEGLNVVEADYTPGATWQASGGTMKMLIEGATSGSGTRFCNTGSITSTGGASTGKIYPSIIKVSGVTNSVANVAVELNGVSTANGGLRAQHLLVAPDDIHNLDFLDQGFSTNALSSVSLKIADGNSYPTESNTPGNGSLWNPTDNSPTVSVWDNTTPTAHSFDSGIPDIPGTINFSYPNGNAQETLEQNFLSISANGDWALYIFDQSSETEVVNSGWCLDFTLNTGIATTTTLASSNNQAGANGAHVGDSPKLTATVKDTNGNINGGTVTFTENGAPPGSIVAPNNTVAVVGGTAALTIPGLTEGDHTIYANYSGDAGDNESEAFIVQRIDHTTSYTIAGNVITACNTGAVENQAFIGSFTPNPSNIFAANIPGKMQKLTVTIPEMFFDSDSMPATSFMLSGPNGKGLDFYSGTGTGTSTLTSTSSITFDDGAAGTVPQTSYGPGTLTYKPTDYTSDVFTASASGFYPLPGTISSAAPLSSATLASTFVPGGTSAIGTWSLFGDVIEKAGLAGGQNGWCLNFTETPVPVTVTTNAVADFERAESNAQFTVDIQNSGSVGPTGDPTQSSNPMTVTDTLDSRLTFAGTYSGSGWTCTGTTTLTCKNESSIAQGASYSELTVNVNVSNTAAGGTFTNTVNTSGAGTTANSGHSTITITVPPSITSANNTTFTVGTAGTFTVTTAADAFPANPSLTITSGSLPSNVTLTDNGNGTATIAGTPAAATGGTYQIQITAHNGALPDAVQTFTLTVDQPPAITSGNNTTFTTGTNGSFQMTATGFPAPTFSETGSLPGGVGLTSAGLLSGTPAAGTGGTYVITVTASNGVGTNATQSFTLTVNQPPAITSANGTTFTVLSNGSFQMTATGFPAPTFSETGALPSPVTLTSAGVLSGTPAAGTAGTYPITVTASNGVSPNATQSFTLTVNAAATSTAEASASTAFSPNAQNVQLSATVTSGASPATTGTVTFTVLQGATVIGTATTGSVNGAGTATVNYGLPASQAAGTYTIQASYNANSTYAASSDNSQTLTISAVTPTMTWTPAGTIIVGDAGAGVLNASVNCTSCGTITYTAKPTGGPVNSITTTSGLAAGAYTIGANFTPSSGNYNATSLTNPLVISGQSVWVVNGGGGTSELAGNGAAITSSAFAGANAAVAIDATGNVWTVGTGATLLEATSQTGIVQSTPSGGGLSAPTAIIIDGSSQSWIANGGNNSVSLFLDNGTASSPSTGFTDSSLSNPSGIAVDLGGSVWVSNQGNNSVTRILGAAAPAAPLSTAAANNTTGARP